jgi:hypothetical protein
MTSLGTDVETHANWQEYTEEPAAKEFVGRITALSNQPKREEPTGTGSSAKSSVEILQKLS